MRATVILRREFPDLLLVITGEGPHRPQVESLISELKLNDVVSLLGGRADIARILQGLDVAVCSSNWEGMPLSVMEYMEAQVPVVATRVGEIPEMITDGVEGLLTEPGDAEGIAKAVAELLRDPDRAAEMGRRGRERRRAEFDLDVTARRVGELYEQLYEASRRGG
jgi:glycosyltransferase involved in cell wall biosynthesis